MINSKNITEAVFAEYYKECTETENGKKKILKKSAMFNINSFNLLKYYFSKNGAIKNTFRADENSPLWRDYFRTSNGIIQGIARECSYTFSGLKEDSLNSEDIYVRGRLLVEFLKFIADSEINKILDINIVIFIIVRNSNSCDLSDKEKHVIKPILETAIKGVEAFKEKINISKKDLFINDLKNFNRILETTPYKGGE